MLTLLSLIIELGFGYPDRLVKSIGHPVIWIGSLISWLDRWFNRERDLPHERKMAGLCATLVIVLVPGSIGYFVQYVFGPGWLGLLASACVASSLIAQRSLASHVRAVADALDHGGIEAGRKAVSQIVGRDPEQLDEAGVCRAAIESLAENFSDGVVAPAVWLGIGGLAGGAAYKAVNTADSMIGHKTPRHQAFGWASARLDDLVNLPASRLTALLVVVAAFFVEDADPKQAWRTVWRDARKHRSPNAGWPEAAVAGALGLALAGPRSYHGVVVKDAYMGDAGRREATAEDIRRALRLYWVADGLLIGLFLVLAVAGVTV
jgi:adenosylcobinamide-phosphate synthase